MYFTLRHTHTRRPLDAFSPRPSLDPLDLAITIGLTATGIFNVRSTLLLDMNPSSPVTAAASVSLTRWLVAAGGVAVIEALVSAIGPGWAIECGWGFVLGDHTCTVGREEERLELEVEKA